MNKMIVAVFIFLVFFACKREYGSFYDPPKNQELDIYKQLSKDSTLSIFVAAVDKVPGLKAELSSSGLYTIVAPNNSAFKAYFSNSLVYKSLQDIPIVTLTQMIKYHIMKWMMFKVDFNKPGLTKNNFALFKYETRADVVYADVSNTVKPRNIYYSSKMIQVYTPPFFSFYSVASSDYTGIYGPTASINTKTQMNVMGASVLESDIAAGNGVIHKIDHVLTPPLNIAQELDTNPEFKTYNSILKKRFLSYTYNKAATIAQGNNGDVNGDGLVDSLWTRTYATDVNLDVENPIGADKISSLSLSAFIPNNATFQNYLNTQLLPNFSNNIDSIPDRTLTLLFRSHITNNLDWPSRVARGYAQSVLADKVNIAQSDIQSSKMASNGLFYTTSKVVEPSAFTTAGGPAFFSSQYWYFAEMLLETSILSYLQSDAVTYTVFAPTNTAFKNRGIYWDNSPVISAPVGNLPAVVGAPGFYKTGGVALKVSEMTSLVGNHIVVGYNLPSTMTPGFYPTLNSSFIVAENSGFHGAERDTIPKIIDPDRIKSNGRFQGINKLIYNPQMSIYDLINSSTTTVNPQYLKFKELISAAGLLAKDFVNITSVDAGKKFTLFVPSNASIIAAQLAGKLPKTGAEGTTVITDFAKLMSYLNYFFIPEIQIFTDGKRTGTFSTNKKLPGTALIYKTVTVSSPSANNLVVTDDTGVAAKVDMLIPRQQNSIAVDGVVQIIDNAFTSQY